ncbi:MULTISPECIES: DUF501 domain-containing protein [unclassified Candidatus Frackibacter]|uniref:DUF501 domain-containing protein n=1 Tax=unclassified Candidatus Frackibacter TaxID=2648818 RepID=UPI00087E30A2|nr:MULTISPECIES: DUF501 domain-containing protein [unclassified Candidatus Frackibacter]SDC66887.1 hypothetical protein SAMN04515661_11846 [Candidatus Frackibacter sp. WG11]SEM80154.1 hypothetical protein SAMN04488698_11747 [Candidatus Frackibacter sp. WG12]SFL90677.1 hypothetical protein SAMN04488699_11947 [Candidatus Frackibacter sp. WG13]
MEQEYTEEDLEVIKKQLGREPRNLVGVGKRCEHGYPQILITYPVFNKEDELGIFPTTYWLSCPELITRISELESEGLVKEIQNEIINDPVERERLLLSYDDYAQNRVELLSSEDLKNLKENYPGRWKVVSESGVGGIMNLEGVKCLHTQYADYLLNKKNPVGKRVEELLKEGFSNSCEEECNADCKE